MIQPIALISPIANPLLAPAPGGDGAAFAQTFDTKLATMLDAAHLSGMPGGQAAAVSGNALPASPVVNLATAKQGFASDPATTSPQTIETAIAVAAVLVPKNGMAIARPTGASLAEDLAITDDLFGEQPTVEMPSIPVAQPQPTKAGTSLPRPITQPARPTSRPARPGLENDLVEADDNDAPAPQTDSDPIAQAGVGLIDPPRVVVAQVLPPVSDDVIVAAEPSAVAEPIEARAAAPTVPVQARPAPTPGQRTDQFAASISIVPSPVPQTGKLRPDAAPIPPGEPGVASGETILPSLVVAEPSHTAIKPSGAAIADATVSPEPSLDPPTPTAEGSVTDEPRSTRGADRPRSFPAVKDRVAPDPGIDPGPTSLPTELPAVAKPSADPVVGIGVGVGVETSAGDRTIDAARTPPPVAPMVTTAAAVPIAPATLDTAAASAPISIPRTAMRAFSPTQAAELRLTPATPMPEARPDPTIEAVPDSPPPHGDFATTNIVPGVAAAPAPDQVARVMPQTIAPVRARPVSLVAATSAAMPAPVVPALAVEPMPAIAPTQPSASSIVATPAPTTGAAPAAPPSPEPTTTLSSPAEPKPSPAAPVLTRIAPRLVEPQPIAAGAAAPAFRLFAAAIHAARSDEGDQRALSAPVPTAPLEQVRGPVAVTGGQGTPLDMTDRRWPQGMIDRIEHLRDTVSAASDAASTSIRLVPDALGVIDVSVRREGDTVHVHFAAEQAATRTLLAEAQPRLAELADAKGIKLAQADVGTGSQAQGQGQATGQNPTRDQRSSAPLSRAPAPAARDEDPDTTTTRVA